MLAQIVRFVIRGLVVGFVFLSLNSTLVNDRRNGNLDIFVVRDGYEVQMTTSSQDEMALLRLGGSVLYLVDGQIRSLDLLTANDTLLIGGAR